MIMIMRLDIHKGMAMSTILKELKVLHLLPIPHILHILVVANNQMTPAATSACIADYASPRKPTIVPSDMIALCQMMVRTVSVSTIFLVKLQHKANFITKLQLGISMISLWVKIRLSLHTGRLAQAKLIPCLAVSMIVRIMASFLEHCNIFIKSQIGNIQERSH